MFHKVFTNFLEFRLEVCLDEDTSFPVIYVGYALPPLTSDHPCSLRREQVLSMCEQLNMIPEIYLDHKYMIELLQQCRYPNLKERAIPDHRLKMLRKAVSG